MKKLNKKGFTLIELLAVIVILAIIVVVTVPTVLNSINDARLSSLHSLSKEVANWYDKTVAQDKLMTNSSNKVLGGNLATEEWQCLRDITNSKGQNIAEIYGLSDNDLVIIQNDIPKNGSFNLDESARTDDRYGTYNLEENLCSAIKIENNRAVVLLVAKDGGKFDTNGDYDTYALNIGQGAFDLIY